MENPIESLRVKILIVDDKKENLLSLQVILANRGYEFVEASSGKEALRILLKDQDFAIILMDVQMPLMDGFETAELIRQSDKLKHVPIIFLTANMDTPDYIFKGYQAGAVDYMIKPLSAEILQAKVMVFAELYKKNLELQIKEEETKRLNKELAEQYAAMEKQANDLQVKNRELDAFTYISSHDLQEPLRKIQTFANLIMSSDYENLSDNGKQKFQRILYSANRMRQLIHSLLTFSRTNITDRQFENVNLNSVIEDLKEVLSENINEKKVTIETNLQQEEVCIIPFQFTQLMQNLISNAIKFAQSDVPPLIKIKTKITKGTDIDDENSNKNENYCHIMIEDNGIGFDPKFSDKIFDVFQKLHDRDTYEGTGIGLAIVKKIVENHNGFIKASGQPMKGAKFDIYLPTLQQNPI